MRKLNSIKCLFIINTGGTVNGQLHVFKGKNLLFLHSNTQDWLGNVCVYFWSGNHISYRVDNVAHMDQIWLDYTRIWHDSPGFGQISVKPLECAAYDIKLWVRQSVVMSVSHRETWQWRTKLEKLEHNTIRQKKACNERIDIPTLHTSIIRSLRGELNRSD